MMKYLLIFIILVSALKCNFKASDFDESDFLYCIKYKTILLSDSFEYDFVKASNDFDKYLLEKKVIKAINKSEYIKIFAGQLQNKIDVPDLHSKVRCTFLGNPHFWSDYVECAKINKSKEWSFLATILSNKFELLSSNEFRISILESIDDNQFQKTEVKLIFQTLIYQDMIF